MSRSRLRGGWSSCQCARLTPDGCTGRGGRNTSVCGSRWGETEKTLKTCSGTAQKCCLHRVFARRPKGGSGLGMAHKCCSRRIFTLGSLRSWAADCLSTPGFLPELKCGVVDGADTICAPCIRLEVDNGAACNANSVSAQQCLHIVVENGVGDGGNCVPVPCIHSEVETGSGGRETRWVGRATEEEEQSGARPVVAIVHCDEDSKESSPALVEHMILGRTLSCSLRCETV